MLFIYTLVVSLKFNIIFTGGGGRFSIPLYINDTIVYYHKFHYHEHVIRVDSGTILKSRLGIPGYVRVGT